jgi:putative Mg2+ transporter-C (MgtC) family protein
MEWIEITLRLGAAMLAGAALGLNRDLHSKPTGVRTLGLVGLGSALAVMAVSSGGSFDAVSRVVQGIVTGIGFLGAGVIVRAPEGYRIHGLTTAACTWLTACLGAVCAVAQWPAFIVSIVLIFALLIFGGPIEKFIKRRWIQRDND